MLISSDNLKKKNNRILGEILLFGIYKFKIIQMVGTLHVAAIKVTEFVSMFNTMSWIETMTTKG